MSSLPDRPPMRDMHLRLDSPANPSGKGTSGKLAQVACSNCGKMVGIAMRGAVPSLLELTCDRCGTNDVYHARSLRPI